MKKSSILAASAIVVAVVLGVLAYIQRAQIIRLQAERTTLVSAVVGVESGDVFTDLVLTIAEKRVEVGDTSVLIRYGCSGEVKKALESIGESEEIPSYCVGDYELVASMDENVYPIVSGASKDGTDAPILLNVEAIAETDNVLISFKPSCISTLDCGVGMSTNNVTYLFQAKDGSAKPISDFPENGTPHWNEDGTKALFIPGTCGGAGCGMSAIVGYDLKDDSSKDMTEEEGVGLIGDMSASDATDVMGDRLPSWKSVEWTGVNSFTAILTRADGTQQEVKGMF